MIEHKPNVDILLVEDNPYEAKLTMMSLREQTNDSNLVHVDDGAEALDFIFAEGAYAHRKNDTPPKMILLDLNLPKVGGLEVLRRVKADERTRFIPIVILSSSRESTDVLNSYALGVNSYVVKPMDFEVFTKSVSDLGTYWMLINEPSSLFVLSKSKLSPAEG